MLPAKRAAILLAILLTSSAQAVEPYLTVGVGKGELMHPGDNKWWIQKGWDYTIDQDSTVWRAGLGVQVSRFLAVEANYHELGKYDHFAGFMVNEDLYVESEPTKCSPHCDPTQWGHLNGSAKAISLSVLPTLPITKDFSVYGRLGMAVFKAKFSARITPMQQDFARGWQAMQMRERGTTPVYGFGVSFKAVSLDYMVFPDVRIDSKGCCSAFTEARTATINYRWSF